jgi:hypothetical protein
MYRFARLRPFAAALFALFIVSANSSAAQEPLAQPDALLASLAPAALPLAPATVVTPDISTPLFVPQARPKRPGALLPLYVSFASLQALDAHSTTRALDRGAVEANPMMRGISGNPFGMLAVKAAGTAGVIYAGEKIWKRNKTAAVLFMLAANSGLALVVQHNYRAVR